LLALITVNVIKSGYKAERFNSSLCWKIQLRSKWMVFG